MLRDSGTVCAAVTQHILSRPYTATETLPQYNFLLRISPASLILLLSSLFLSSGLLSAEPIAVRYPEGSVHGYLALRSLDGKLLAAGDLVQTVHGARLISRLVYRFKDGSLDDETAVFTQHGYFRLISDHHVQRGPMFPKPIDVTIQATTGQITVRYQDKDQEKVETSHVDLPADLANGILLDVLKNIPAEAKETKISYLAATPKPKLIQLSVQPEGKDAFRSAGTPNKALRFKVHVEMGGITGVVAPLIGKEPPDAHVWIGVGEVPAFIRSEALLYLGGPILRTELVSPVWPPTSKFEREGQRR